MQTFAHEATSPSNWEDVKLAVTSSGLVPIQKPKTTKSQLDYLILYGNSKLTGVAPPNSRKARKPEIGKNAKSASDFHMGAAKRHAEIRLAQLRYALLVQALIGTVWLLTAMLLSVLTSTALPIN
jgi:hypothetical protein